MNDYGILMLDFWLIIQNWKKNFLFIFLFIIILLFYIFLEEYIKFIIPNSLEN